ncbi:MAG: MarR family winged helix-turn-helix transcriptional regulator [Candidatus Levyibacteriota bacterium]
MDQAVTTKFIETMFKSTRLLRGYMEYSTDVAQLSILQIQTLSFLKHHKNAQMGEIAEYFHIELSSATSLLNKLVALQLVIRQPDPKDRRLVRISLIKKGTELLQKVLDAKCSHFGKMLSYLSDTEKNELLRLLEKLNKRMEQNNEN